ncbi:MAG: hypothetical protein K2Q01_12075, partial [Rickettsiales bacterium]|nr:hypothetical protein [Rickettsiales bacterium]
MRFSYSIWIISPEGLIWSRVFGEVALGLQAAFRELGYDAPIVTDGQQVSGRAVVLGANLAAMYGISLPANAIIYNLEQVHASSRWFKPEAGYAELLKRHVVWDFSARNIEALKGFGVEAIHCRIGYAEALSRIRPAKQDVDVLFIGGGHPRRGKVLEDIAGRGARLKTLYQVFGAERDAWIARGKIHLNMHKEPAELFEIVRVSYLLANKCFVISEEGQDKALEAPLAKGLVFAPYEMLAETCLHYLVKPKERKAIAEAGFEAFREMKMRDYLDRALAATERLSKPATTGPRIFVAMASYRDPEVQPTIVDLLRRAAQPGRIRVGVCVQNAPEDVEWDVDEARFGGQVKVVRVKHTDTKGANWARVQALSLMEDEAYVLLIDSHMRFQEGWDEALLSMLSRCPAEKPVISGYVPNYEPPNHRFHHPQQLLRVRVKHMEQEREALGLRISGVLVAENDAERAGLYPSPLAVANFLFAPAQMLAEVPLDPHIHFWGDETSLAARLWTHGYDIFQPDQVVAFHYWVRKDTLHLHGYRKPDTQENRESAMRVEALLSGRLSGEYGLGRARALADLWAFAGIDWNRRSWTPEAEEGIWNMAARDKGRQKSAMSTGISPRIFVQIASYRDPECQWTVKDLFEKAAHPERITVGICWQFVKEEDGICFQQPYARPEQVRVHEVDARQGKGVCWARGLTQKLWQGEEYTLQIDSHMRFEPGWDSLLLDMLRDCKDERAVLTCYP